MGGKRNPNNIRTAWNPWCLFGVKSIFFGILDWSDILATVEGYKLGVRTGG
jgi:hypothetical protein